MHAHVRRAPPDPLGRHACHRFHAPPLPLHETRVSSGSSTARHHVGCMLHGTSWSSMHAAGYSYFSSHADAYACIHDLSCRASNSACACSSLAERHPTQGWHAPAIMGMTAMATYMQMRLCSTATATARERRSGGYNHVSYQHRAAYGSHRCPCLCPCAWACPCPYLPLHRCVRLFVVTCVCVVARVVVSMCPHCRCVVRNTN